MRPISALVPPRHSASWLGSILGKLSMAERSARKITTSDVLNMNSAACRGAGSASGAQMLVEGLAELPFVTRRCQEPRAGSSDKVPYRLRSPL